MEIAEHVNALRREGEWLADAAERAGLDATVPPCAPWQVKDLLRHTGYVHRWAARHITERPDQIIDGPSEEEILSELLPNNLAVQIYTALLENAASEQGARMTAMDNATRNAGDMIDRLTMNYNRTRQAVITKELIEIISGAEAL